MQFLLQVGNTFLFYLWLVQRKDYVQSNLLYTDLSQSLNDVFGQNKNVFFLPSCDYRCSPRLSHELWWFSLHSFLGELILFYGSHFQLWRPYWWRLIWHLHSDLINRHRIHVFHCQHISLSHQELQLNRSKLTHNLASTKEKKVEPHPYFICHHCSPSPVLFLMEHEVSSPQRSPRWLPFVKSYLHGRWHFALLIL